MDEEISIPILIGVRPRAILGGDGCRGDQERGTFELLVDDLEVGLKALG